MKLQKFHAANLETY